MKNYLINFLLGFDQWMNTWFNGQADESMSSHFYRLEKAGKWAGKIGRPVTDWIFGLFGQEDHCHHAYLSELNRTQLDRDFTIL